MQVDYIIVGQGLAGSALAFTLIKKGLKVLVIDRNEPHTSSKVAAGIFNPITGKRMIKTWKADLLFPFMKDFYKELEVKTETKFFNETGIFKPFSSEEEEKYYLTYSAKNFPELVNTDIDPQFYLSHLKGFMGGVEVLSSGYVNVKLMLHACSHFFKKQEALIEDSFDMDDLVVGESSVDWKGIKARKIIFCEGHCGKNNEYFKWLPLTLTKGEIITATIENFHPEKLINKGVYIVPYPGKEVKIGATYDWTYQNDQPTEAGLAELKYKIDQVLKDPYIITNHEAGIRPTVKDRKPLIGLHPVYKTLGIFNGMGTKGLTLAPYFAEQFYQSLENNKELDVDINIERYYTLYNQNANN